MYYYLGRIYFHNKELLRILLKPFISVQMFTALALPYHDVT